VRLIKYLYYFVIKKIYVYYVLKKENITSEYIIKDGFFAIIIISKFSVYKIAINKKSTIFKEYSNYTCALKKYYEFKDKFPLLFLKKGIISYLISDKLHIIEPNNILQSASILLLSVRNKKHSNMIVSQLPQIEAGLYIVKRYIGPNDFEVIRNLVNEYVLFGNYTTGFCHGDFHKRNIMKDNKGELKYIDYDCIRLKGIQEIDCLYFLHDYYFDFYKNIWYSTIHDFFCLITSKIDHKIINMFNLKINSSLLLLYLIDRIGQERINDNFIIPKNDFIKIINFFIEEN
jgi:hypothetical protein